MFGFGLHLGRSAPGVGVASFLEKLQTEEGEQIETESGSPIIVEKDYAEGQ